VRVLPANLVEEEGGKMERMKEEKEKADAVAGQFFLPSLLGNVCLHPTKNSTLFTRPPSFLLSQTDLSLFFRSL
jgi:hypothetical protein